jgi:methyltransferase (TIGR00027 family)
MPAVEHPLPDIFDARVVTHYLHSAVAAAREFGIEITEMRPGESRGLLPLLLSNTNHHGTHSAMALGMAADYLGVFALASIFPDSAAIGLWPDYTGAGMTGWTTSTQIEYFVPSTTDVHLTARVAPEGREDAQMRASQGRGSKLDVDVEMTSTLGEPVARAKFSYYVKSAEALRPTEAQPLHPLRAYQEKSSARLVASLRGAEASSDRPLYEDPYSVPAAGKQGEVLAARFSNLVPELQPMIASRTRHADDALRAAYTQGTRQLVMVGAGLDFRPMRLARECPDLQVFEVDLPEMIAERGRVLEEWPDHGPNRVEVPMNLLFEPLTDRLCASEEFDRDAPVFVIYEGCSMYFREHEGRPILENLAALVNVHPESRLWVDFVSNAIISGELDYPTMGQFLEGMALLGEPFRFGTDRPSDLLGEFGLEVCDCVKSHHYVNEDRPNTDGSSELFENYRFVVARSSERGHQAL